MPRLELVETSLRAGQQALLLSRLRQRHAVDVARALDGCGFAALDVFGGSTFEAALRFLGEDPFSRLRALREAAPQTRLLAAVGGQSLLGHRQLADDVVDLFARVIAECGIDIVRCYDSLNDPRNLQRLFSAVAATGKTVEGVIVYSDSPRHDPERILGFARRLVEMGAASLCLQDPLGLLGIRRTDDLVRELVATTNVPLTVSFSAQTGQADLAVHAAVRAGAQRADCALAPLAGGASLPAAEALIAAHIATDVEVPVPLERVAEASLVLERSLSLYEDAVDPWAQRLDTAALRGLLPPAAMGHALEELRERDALDRLADVEMEAVRIRAELGHPPMVTPMAEIVATQAVYNVVDGERYLTVSQEVKDYCLGLYGSPPEPLSEEVRRKVNGREEPITCRPADLIEAQVEGLRGELQRQGIDPVDDAAVVTFALFPTEYLALRRGEARVERLGDEPVEAEAASAHPEAEEHEAPVAAAPEPAPVQDVRELTVEVDGQSYSVRVVGSGLGGGAPAVSAAPATAAPAATVREGTVVAPMQGLILKVPVGTGDTVAIGDVVAVLEAMKMQNDITATRAGAVTAVHVKEGTVVSPRDPIVDIG